jgi:hypothetical protein
MMNVPLLEEYPMTTEQFGPLTWIGVTSEADFLDIPMARIPTCSTIRSTRTDELCKSKEGISRGERSHVCPPHAR